MFGRRCSRCSRKTGDEYSTVIVDARTIAELCDGCACLYTRGLIEVAGVRCPDAETINSPALAARRWSELFR